MFEVEMSMGGERGAKEKTKKILKGPKVAPSGPRASSTEQARENSAEKLLGNRSVLWKQAPGQQAHDVGSSRLIRPSIFFAFCIALSGFRTAVHRTPSVRG